MTYKLEYTAIKYNKLRTFIFMLPLLCIYFNALWMLSTSYKM